MWEKSRFVYQQVASQLNLRIIPTGDAFQAVSADLQWKFVPDTNYNYEVPLYPQLPDEKNSLNVGYSWDKNKKLKLDANHASPAGCYLGALTWYSTLFGKSPVRLKFYPDEVPPDFARYLRKISWDTVTKKSF